MAEGAKAVKLMAVAFAVGHAKSAGATLPAATVYSEKEWEKFTPVAEVLIKQLKALGFVQIGKG